MTLLHKNAITIVTPNLAWKLSFHNNICCDPSLIPSMEIIRLNFSPHPNRRSSTYNQYPCYENTSTIKYYFRPKPEKKKIKPIEKPVVDPRKLSEPYTPKPIIRKLPQRKLSDTISLPLHPTYEYLHIMLLQNYNGVNLVKKQSPKRVANRWAECRD